MDWCVNWRIDAYMDGWWDQSKVGWIDGWMDKRNDGLMDALIDGCIDVCMVKWTGESKK